MLKRRPGECFLKSLSELRVYGSSLKRPFTEGSSFEVDIELLLERHGYVIDTVPLRSEQGVEAWSTPGCRVIYVDIGLADGRQKSIERRYRMTLAEEFAHGILHAKLYKDVSTYDEWARVWDSIPDDVHDHLDKNAKELAGIVLMPEDKFTKRMYDLRNIECNKRNIEDTPSLAQQSQITLEVTRKLMDDFNVNEDPCRIRISRITYKKGLFGVS